MDYYYRRNERIKARQSRKPVKRRSRWLLASVIILITVVGAGLFLFLTRSGDEGAAAMAERIKRIVMVNIFGEMPRFYSLDIERNGQDVRLEPGDHFEVTYRDEFFIKEVRTDVLLGRGVTVEVDGTGHSNDMGLLLKGEPLVDQAMEDSSRKFFITLRHNGRDIYSIPMDVNIQPQDWLRMARGTESTESRIEFLTQAVSLRPDDVNARKMLAHLYVDAGKTDEAVAQYRAVLSRSPDDIHVLVELTKLYEKTKRYEDALTVYRRLIRLDSRDATAYAGIGRIYEQMGNRPRAAANYEASLRLDPTVTPVRYRLAEMYEKTGEKDKAADAYKAVLDTMPDNDAIAGILAGLYLELSRYEEAIELYRVFIRRNPGNAAAYANIALAYSEAGEPSREIANLEKALSLDSNDSVIAFNLAVAYEKAGRHDDAVRTYQRVLKLKPDDPEALERLAHHYLTRKDYAKAIGAFRKIIGFSPRNAAAHRGLGFACQETGDYKNAAAAYEQAIKLGMKDADIRYNLAVAYDQIGKKKEAIAAYESYAALQPTVEVLVILADAYVGESNFAQAVSTYERLVGMDGRNPGFHRGLGRSLYLRGDLDRAIDSYKRAIAHDREDYRLYLELAECYEKKGLYEDALREYSYAYRLNPESAQAMEKIPEMRIKLLQLKHQA
ncbi:MAG: tetratricopeptide repeat protein [Syntrophales bacterium]|jgi:tetratricopeptide (TPR) repeat protein|nr:tetratricopeptide repeat protein [Syntrophales bacterium]MCK9527453.1 tetratricopeptide repeat protein [Syntrophales bacterium]MDX9921557.1 tetratricopeptide repeat protein [Syntrophales bacterium]